MRILIIYLLLFGVVTAPNSLVAQPNRISVQTGLFHCFFDGSSLLNTNYMQKDRGIFGGLLYNSVSIQYQRMINSKSAVSAESAYFYEYYWNVHPNLLKNVVTRRTYMTYNLNYDRYIPLSETLNFTYGGGINYRQGMDWIVVNYGSFGMGNYESLIESRIYRDIGINTRIGIEYSPWKWLTLHTKFDLLGLVYIHDKEQIERIKSYNYKSYPHRFDLSWRFGIGFNFGSKPIK